MFEKIKKRDQRIVEFDSSKITAAIAKAGNATAEFSDHEARKMMAEIYDWFTEGFDIPDLVAAKSLMEELS